MEQFSKRSAFSPHSIWNTLGLISSSFSGVIECHHSLKMLAYQFRPLKAFKEPLNVNNCEKDFPGNDPN